MNCEFKPEDEIYVIRWKADDSLADLCPKGEIALFEAFFANKFCEHALDKVYYELVTYQDLVESEEFQKYL